MRNLFNLNESEKNRILSLHDKHKLKMYGLIKEAPETQTTVNEYLSEPRLGDPFMYLKVGDENPTYYIKVTDKPSGKYANMTRYPEVKANWESVSSKYPNWTPATATQSTGIASKVTFQTTPVPGGIINKTNVNANVSGRSVPTLEPNDNQKVKLLDNPAVNADGTINTSYQNQEIQRNLDLKTRKDGQINTQDAAKQIKQQDKNAQKLIQQMEKTIVDACLIPVKNIEKSYFGKGLFRRAMKPEEIDELLKQDKIKQELITNLTELYKKIYIPAGTMQPIDSGKRCIDYDKVKQQIAKFPNFKPEELAKKVGLDINNLSEKPKNVTPPKAAADEFIKNVSKGTSTGGSGMGAMAKSDAEFDAMLNQGTNTSTAQPKVDLTNTSGPVNTDNQTQPSVSNEKIDYLRSQLNTANNPSANTNTKPNEPDEEDYLSGTLGSKFK